MARSLLSWRVRSLKWIPSGLAVSGSKTLLCHLDVVLFPAGLGAKLLGCFDALALVLAAVGIYGMVAYRANHRTAEIGVRLGLGARAPDVVHLIVAECLRQLAAGALIGLLLSLAATRAPGAFLYDVSPADPVTFAAVALLLTGVPVIAAWLPARRVARIDPMEALRHTNSCENRPP